MIYNYNEQLGKQNTQSNLTQTKMGHGRALMAVLGYDALGQQNTWGKILSASPVGVGAGLRHRIATGVADGTSKEVMRDTQDEASAMAWSKAALTANIIKTAAGGGFSGLFKNGGDIAKNISGSGIDNLTGDTQFGTERGMKFKSFINDLFGKDGVNEDIQKLTDQVMSQGQNVNPGAKNAIGDILTGDMFSSIGNAIIGTSNYLKADDESLKKIASNNYGSETMNYL